MAACRRGSAGSRRSAGRRHGPPRPAAPGAPPPRVRIPGLGHSVGMLLPVRAVGMLLTGGHSVGRLPIAALSFGRGDLLGLPGLLWIAVAVYLAAALALGRTALGRELFQVGTNRRAAAFNGLRVARTRFLGFLVSGTLAGL